MIKEETEALRADVEKEYKERLAALEKEYREKLNALEIVGRMLASRNSTARPKDELSGVVAKPDTPNPLPGDSEPEAQESLIDEVGKLFSTQQDRTWNVVTLEAALNSRGFVFGSDNPKGGLNSSLRKLVERGNIRIVRHGKGRKPSIYRFASRITQAHENNGAEISATEGDSDRSLASA